MNNILIPNSKIPELHILMIRSFWIIVALIFWMNSPLGFLPSFTKVLNAFPKLLTEDLLITEFISSAKLYLYSILITLIIASVACFSGVIPFLKPISSFLSKLRAMSLIGMLIVFTILTPNGYWLKVCILVFSICPWLITSMNGIIASIPQDRYEYARTLKMNELLVTWHIVIRGQLHQYVEAFRQVAAMGIVLLPVAERLSRADGGIGFVLTNLERFQKLDKIYAIQIIIVLVAIGQDYLIKYIRDWFCPYATMIEEGKK